MENAVARGVVRGVVAAMAMSGMRTVTTHLGLVEATPPQALAERARGLLLRIPAEQRPAAVELLHWAVGASAGAAFGLLPAERRRPPWAGPAWGLAVWLVFEAVVTPALGLRRAERRRVTERLALAADHVLYGLLVTPRERA